MARSSFGGSGDYSSLFSSLYNQAKALKDQQQSAADQDAQDRWQNGLMSDTDWLAYIQQRVNATASDKDPTTHQKWIDLQRQYITSIADSTAEYSYSSGQSSIGDLIQYYQDRLSRLQTDSEEYRTLSGHLNDLIDQRDSNDLSQGAAAINSKIQVGKATYEDLLSFYQTQLKTLRPNSDLYKQVASEITNVQDTISQTKLNGRLEQLQYQYQVKQISGATYAAQLRAIAAPFRASDPQKYYQLLEAAANVGAAGSGGGGGGGGTGSLSKSQKTTEQQLLAMDNYYEQFATAYKAGARVIPDPNHPGQNIVLTPELMTQVDQGRLANYDKLATLYKSAGSAKKYTQTLENKTSYIVNYVQPHNTVAASQQWGQLVQSASKAIDAFKDNPDPAQALKSIVTSLNGMKGWLQGEVVKNGQIVNAANEPTGDFVNNTSSFVDQALAALTDPNMDSATRTQTLAALASSLDTDSGADYDKGTAAAMKSLLTRAGAISSGAFDLASGKKVLVITPDQGIVPVDVKIQHTVGADPKTGAPVSADLPSPDVRLGSGQRLQEVWIDQGGTPTKVYAVTDTAPSPYQAWVAKKSVTIGVQTYAAGAAIPSSVLSSSNWTSLVQSGAVVKEDAFTAAGAALNYIQVPAYDDNGKHYDATTYYQDPQTKLWYRGQPPIGSVQLNDDGTVKIGSDGKLGINWMPFANVGGVAVPYMGSNDQQMQSFMDQGLVGQDPRYNEQTGYRDGVGNYSATPVVDGTMAYYDPRDESARAAMRTGLSPASEPVPDAQEQLRTAVAAARQRAVTLQINQNDQSNQQIDVSKVAVNLNKLAQGLGITLTNQKDDFGLPVVAPNAAAMAARRQKLQAELSIPTIKAAPIDVPDPNGNPVPGQLASGPALANLPKLAAQDIDLSKITALPAAKAPAPAPVTAKTAPIKTATTTTTSSSKVGKYLE